MLAIFYDTDFRRKIEQLIVSKKKASTEIDKEIRRLKWAPLYASSYDSIRFADTFISFSIVSLPENKPLYVNITKINHSFIPLRTEFYNCRSKKWRAS